MAQADLINQILRTDYLDNAGIKEFEYVRENLRDLIKYIPEKNFVMIPISMTKFFLWIGKNLNWKMTILKLQGKSRILYSPTS